MSNEDGASAPETIYNQEEIEAVQAEIAAEEETIRKAEERRRAKAAQGIVALERMRIVVVKDIADYKAMIVKFETARAAIESLFVELRLLTNGEQKELTRDIGIGKWIREFMRQAVEWTTADVVTAILAERPQTNTDTMRKTLRAMANEGSLIVEGSRSHRIYTSREMAIKLGKITVEPKTDAPLLPKPPDTPESDDAAPASEGSTDGASESQEMAQEQEDTKPTKKPIPKPKPPVTKAQIKDIGTVGYTLGLDCELISRRSKYLYGKDVVLINCSEADDFYELLTEELNRCKRFAGMDEGTRIRDVVKGALFACLGEAATKKLTRKEEEWHRAELGLTPHQWNIALFHLRETQELFTSRRADRCLFIAKSDTSAAAADAKVEINPLFGSTKIPDHI